MCLGRLPGLEDAVDVDLPAISLARAHQRRAQQIAEGEVVGKAGGAGLEQIDDALLLALLEE